MDDNLPPEKKLSWWVRRTRTEKCLMFLAVFCVIVIIYLASNLLMTFPNSKGLKLDVCMTEKCIHASANLQENIDRTVDPCEDFYKFACGKFVKNAIVPNDKSAISPFIDTGDKVFLQLLTLFEEPMRDEDPHSLKLVKSIYNSCMNTSKLEQEGIDFVKREFRDFGGWPVIDPNWNEKFFDWRTLLYRLTRNGWRHTFFFSMSIHVDLKNSSKHVFTISQAYISYESLKKGFNETSVRAYHDYLVELSVLFGAGRSTAISEMREVVEFETDLAHFIIPEEERKNATLEYNLFTIRELQRNFSSFPWLKLINNYLSPVDVLTSDDVVVLRTPKYFEKLDNFLPNVKKRTLANYMFSKLIVASINYLPEIFQRKRLEYARVLYGKSAVPPRGQLCVWEATKLHISALSSYVKKYYGDDDMKQKLSEITNDIKSSFLDILERVGWMDRKTKKQTILKAEHLRSLIGYPEEILDESFVENYYRGLELNPEDPFLKLVFNISTFHHIKDVLQLREPVKKPDWISQALLFHVNAYYLKSDNSIVLPSAILQGNFFDKDQPQYMNYGAIGYIIGHEITHGFDDRGRQYDKDGNVVDWWDPETNKAFVKKTQCLVEQYGNLTIPDMEMSPDGVTTLSKNIADNGGIKIAYRGYMKWLERNKPEQSLPGLPYSARQLFWISAASNWCTKFKEEALKRFATSQYHSHPYFRVVVPFMNSDHFGRDFNCPLGSPMNPRYKCRVW